MADVESTKNALGLFLTHEDPAVANIAAMALEALTAVRTDEEFEKERKRYHATLKKQHKRTAITNKENAALQREITKLRTANHVLQRSLDAQPAAGYKIRYEKLVETLGLIRELADPGVTGVPYDLPKTLKPWEPYIHAGRATPPAPTPTPTPKES